jgi:hypothetical protein
VALDEAAAQRAVDSMPVQQPSGTLTRATLPPFDVEATRPARAGGGNLAAVGTGGPPKLAHAVPQPPSPGVVTLERFRAIENTSLTADAVRDKIATSYLEGIRACYRTLLQAKPNATGRLEASFTVELDHITSVDVRESSRASDFPITLISCCRDAMHAWRFPRPHNASGEPALAHFAMQLDLDP